MSSSSRQIASLRSQHSSMQQDLSSTASLSSGVRGRPGLSRCTREAHTPRRVRSALRGSSTSSRGLAGGYPEVRQAPLHNRNDLRELHSESRQVLRSRWQGTLRGIHPSRRSAHPVRESSAARRSLGHAFPGTTRTPEIGTRIEMIYPFEALPPSRASQPPGCHEWAVGSATLSTRASGWGINALGGWN